MMWAKTRKRTPKMTNKNKKNKLEVGKYKIKKSQESCKDSDIRPLSFEKEISTLIHSIEEELNQ
jgi:hypothetical protein